MLELNRIYNSDCIEGMKQIESGEVDLIVTDPPYCISYKTGRRADNHRFSKEILNDDNEQLIIDYMSECYRILKDDSAAYIFCSAKTLDFFYATSEERRVYH
jgi:site-specific DNA-methyltransferase (adenine-specific)